jgi:hypothetical protein
VATGIRPHRPPRQRSTRPYESPTRSARREVTAAMVGAAEGRRWPQRLGTSGRWRNHPPLQPSGARRWVGGSRRRSSNPRPTWGGKGWEGRVGARGGLPAGLNGGEAGGCPRLGYGKVVGGRW